MAQAGPAKQHEGLSLATLVIAAVASAIAAVVVSHIWRNGTVIAAAMTPVVVSIVKELLQRPAQSEAVRRSATSARRALAGTAAARTADARRHSPAVGAVPTPARPPGDGEVTQGDVLLTHPRRTYGGGPARGAGAGGLAARLSGRHLKVALLTGVLAFVVAVAALTLPELIFGGAVSSGGSTTIFGGGGSSKSDAKNKSQDQTGNSGTSKGTSTQPSSGAQPSQTAPQQSPSQTTPQQTPAQPPQQQQQPPSSGSGSGGVAPSAPSAPTPSAP